MRFKGPDSRVRFSSDDGRVYVENDQGEQVYLETAAPTGAVHGNAGFEDETAGVPDVWDFFWGDGTPASDTTVVYSGERSLRVDLAPGDDFLVALSNTFDVPSRSAIDFSTFAVKTLGDPTISLGLLTGASGDPVFLDPDNYTNNEGSASVIGTDWGRYSRPANVPGGHTKARLFFRVTPEAAEACTAYLDFTTSAVSSPSVADTGWLGLGYTANWADAGFGRQAGQCRVIGDELQLRGLAARSGSSSGTAAVIAELPDEFPAPPADYTWIGDAYYPAAGGTASTQLYIFGRQIVTSVSIPAGAFVPFYAEVSLL